MKTKVLFITIILSFSICLYSCEHMDGPCDYPMQWELVKNSDPESVRVKISSNKDKSDEITIDVAPKGGMLQLDCISHETFRLMDIVNSDKNQEYSTEWFVCQKKNNSIYLNFINEEDAPEDRDFILNINSRETHTAITIQRHINGL